MTEPRAALALLRRQPDAVSRICTQFDVDLLIAFGSATSPESPESSGPPADPSPRDLDLAARRLGGRLELVGLLDALAAFTDCNNLDLMDLSRANPLARSRAVEFGVLLHEAKQGAFVKAQLAAMMERMDTAWLRQLNLEALASRR